MTSDGSTVGIQKRLDLQELVKSATWKELLVGLVETNSVDPWDIDIVKIANEYRMAVKKMQFMDLHIPANMVLASSILLRMKSDTMEIFPQVEVTDELQEPFARTAPQVEGLVPKLRIQPKRKITLNELMDALNDAIKVSETRERRLVERSIIPEALIITEQEDIDQKIEEAHRIIRMNIKEEGKTTYSKLSRLFGSESEAVFRLFIPILFLASRGKINAFQSEFYEEIELSLEKQNKSGINGRK